MVTIRYRSNNHSHLCFLQHKHWFYCKKRFPRFIRFSKYRPQFCLHRIIHFKCDSYCDQCCWFLVSAKWLLIGIHWTGQFLSLPKGHQKALACLVHVGTNLQAWLTRDSCGAKVCTLICPHIQVHQLSGNTFVFSISGCIEIAISAIWCTPWFLGARRVARSRQKYFPYIYKVNNLIGYERVDQICRRIFCLNHRFCTPCTRHNSLWIHWQS